MRILHLTLTYRYFHMIRNRIKFEEYREIKPFWVSRLSIKNVGAIGGDFMDKHQVIAYVFKEFDIVRFTNGYSKKSPTMDVECKGIRVDIGNLKWGAKRDVEYFVISLGNILSTSNL